MRLKNEKSNKIVVYKFDIDQSDLEPKIAGGSITVEIAFKNGKFNEVALPGCLLDKPFTRSHWKIYGDIAQMIDTLEMDTGSASIEPELENALALIYQKGGVVAYSAVAQVCDEILDPSGALLGRIRDLAAPESSE